MDHRLLAGIACLLQPLQVAPTTDHCNVMWGKGQHVLSMIDTDCVLVVGEHQHDLEYFNQLHQSFVTMMISGNVTSSLFDDILGRSKEPCTVVIQGRTTHVQQVLGMANWYDSFGTFPGYLGYYYRWLIFLDGMFECDAMAIAIERDVTDIATERDVTEMHNRCNVTEMYTKRNVTEIETSISRLLHVTVIQASTCDKLEVFTIHNSADNVRWLRKRYDDVDTSTRFELFPNVMYRFNQQQLIISYNTWPGFIEEVRDDEGRITDIKGISIEILVALQRAYNFTYILEMAPDYKWGSLVNGSWNGNMGHVVRGEAQMAIAPLSRTYGRSQAVDFSTTAYYTDFVTALIRTPTDSDKMIFIRPFRYPVWLSIAASVLLVAIFLVILSFDFQEGQPQPSLGLTITQMIGCLCLQGTMTSFRRPAAQPLYSLWWIFCILITAAYSGNLVSFLSVSRPVLPFRTLEDLVADKTYKIGMVGASAYYDDLKSYTTKVYKDLNAKIVRFAEDDPDILHPIYASHVERVLQEPYVYLCDNSVVEYLIENCNYTRISGIVLPKKFQYSIMYGKGSVYGDLFSKVLLDLQVQGLVEKWRHTFFSANIQKCVPKRTKGVVYTVEYLYNVVLVLGALLLLSTFVLLFENCWGEFFSSRNIRRSTRELSTHD